MKLKRKKITAELIFVNLEDEEWGEVAFSAVAKQAGLDDPTCMIYDSDGGTVVYDPDWYKVEHLATFIVVQGADLNDEPEDDEKDESETVAESTGESAETPPAEGDQPPVVDAPVVEETAAATDAGSSAMPEEDNSTPAENAGAVAIGEQTQ